LHQRSNLFLLTLNRYFKYDFCIEKSQRCPLEEK
jgi:hypothetical protein